MDFKNARPWPQNYRNSFSGLKNTVPGKQKFIENRVNKGMITMLDPADIPPGALQMARNARCRFDITSRRPGTKLLDPLKPDGENILGIFFYKKNSGETFYFRFTRSAIYSRTGGSWTPYTIGAGGSLAGAITDQYQAAVILDRFVFANNGVDVLQELDTGALTYKALGNAPQYRYITGFFNRVIGANLAGGSPDGAQIGWSGDKNIDEWDPLVDETAGSSPLVESPSDLGDFITGVFSFTNVMVVLREQSIWLATKQPIPSNPFNFYTAFPGVGCNCPQSAKITLNGITWADRRSGSIWHYSPGAAEPERIGLSIEKTLMDGLTDETQVFAGYDSIQQEYTLCIPQVGSRTVICWTYNFRTRSWVKDEYQGVTCISNADLSSAVTTIDELIGTIDSLIGTIDELSPSQTVVPTRAFGRGDGNIILEDDDVTTDPDFFGADGNYETELLSKSFTLPTIDVYIAEIRIELIAKAVGAVRLEFSKDGGKTLTSAFKSFQIPGDKLGKPIILQWTRLVKCRRYAWRLTATSGQFDVIGYEVHVYQSGESTK